jgi:hypothetical protein
MHSPPLRCCDGATEPPLLGGRGEGPSCCCCCWELSRDSLPSLGGAPSSVDPRARCCTLRMAGTARTWAALPNLVVGSTSCACVQHRTTVPRRRILDTDGLAVHVVKLAVTLRFGCPVDWCWTKSNNRAWNVLLNVQRTWPDLQVGAFCS